MSLTKSLISAGLSKELGVVPAAIAGEGIGGVVEGVLTDGEPAPRSSSSSRASYSDSVSSYESARAQTTYVPPMPAQPLYVTAETSLSSKWHRIATHPGFAAAVTIVSFLLLGVLAHHCDARDVVLKKKRDQVDAYVVCIKHHAPSLCGASPDQAKTWPECVKRHKPADCGPRPY